MHKFPKENVVKNVSMVVTLAMAFLVIRTPFPPEDAHRVNILKHTMTDVVVHVWTMLLLLAKIVQYRVQHMSMVIRGTKIVANVNV
jgi:hypothetical protein